MRTRAAKLFIMPTPEQLPLDFNPKFDHHHMDLAHFALRKLKNIDSNWPAGVEPYSQTQWDTFKHNAYDRGWLDRRIDRMIERGRIPFHIRRAMDEGTGEVTDYPAFSSYEYAEFMEFKAKPKTTISGGRKKRKPRVVHAPNKPMEYVHEAFNAWANENYPLSESAYGSDGDKSYLEAAIAHAGNRYFLKLDIASAYDCVDPQRLAVELADTDGSTVGPGGWFMIARRFFIPRDHTKGLATGGNASPILFNIYMRPVDEALSHYAQAYGMTYTRYMDDIVFSAPDTGRPEFDQIGRGKARFVKQVLAAVGMSANDHKVRYTDLQTDGPILMTGTQLDADGVWQIPEKVVRNIAEFLDNSKDFLESGDAKDDHDLLTLVGEIHGINSYTQHFVSRRTDQIHPSEALLSIKYRDCVEVIRRKWPNHTAPEF
jgi:hypothetical protein